MKALHNPQSSIKVIKATKSTPLFYQHQEHPWVYHIKQGFVVIHGCSLDGKDGLTDLYGPGSWFGPGLDNYIAAQSATAKKGCELERLSPDGFKHYLQDQPEAGYHIIQQLSNREQQLQTRLFLQQTSPLAGRLAQLLMHYFTKHGRPCTHGHDVDIHLSQQELASMAGSSRQSVSQLLAEWKRSGAIDYTRQFICLEDHNKLQDYF